MQLVLKDLVFLQVMNPVSEMYKTTKPADPWLRADTA